MSRSRLFKCGFCGFVYEDGEAAEECELRCVTRALGSIEKKIPGLITL